MASVMSVDRGFPVADSAARIADITRSLYERRSLDGDVAAELVEHAATELPGAEYANITVTAGLSEIDTPAATNQAALRIDDIHRRTGEGPCISTTPQHRVVHVEDLSRETRWPTFAPRRCRPPPCAASWVFSCS
ncbi:hypothetical protein ACQ856_24300 [Mycolicibacterium psychrotolerans]|uniref:hypothetical protein n=1 Tax=Mycolicibacterium psychrotolerans TaxID=216929 RepID=UPI003D66F8D2